MPQISTRLRPRIASAIAVVRLMMVNSASTGGALLAPDIRAHRDFRKTRPVMPRASSPNRVNRSVVQTASRRAAVTRIRNIS